MTTNTNQGCLALIFSIFSPKKTTAGKERLPYKLRDNILSTAEFSFYKVLQSITQENFQIQCKVRLADIFYTPYGTNISHFNKISGKHADFLLCDKNMKPVLAIELDDSSHTRPDRQDRDIFVDEILYVLS